MAPPAPAAEGSSAAPPTMPSGESAPERVPPAARSDRKTRSAPKPIGFGGAQKIAVSTRTYRPIWDAYSDLAAELTREGRGRVFQNDLLNAVLAVCLPADAAAARARLAEYRALLEADPPRDLRTLS